MTEDLLFLLLQYYYSTKPALSAGELATYYKTYPATVKRLLSKVDLYQPPLSDKWFQLKTTKIRVGRRGPESTAWYLEEVE